ncbi:lipopolysaccharide kinase InaA family protein [Salegentibacter chungangensis]|uniref:Lipopolysaccharide kinase InaA family protein n=1 Tax=Salegentibacter chungangensis TaxID=1335724 RepID=A0ABW3NR68_9FLAO
MKAVFSEAFEPSQQKILGFVKNFRQGELFGDQNRNEIRLFDLGDKKLNIKSFKVPNAVNKIAYRFFRKSKAERSFYYAQHLLSKDIGTPEPVAFMEQSSAFTFGKSYYISEHLQADLTYRELVKDPDYPDHEEILRSFTRFTYKLHENNIEFLDHSPGNTLIRLNNGNYEFFLVDLNRMNFKPLNFTERMNNFARLTPKKEMVEIMADEYAKLTDRSSSEVFEKMWYFTNLFQEKFRKKQRLKEKLKFWK